VTDQKPLPELPRSCYVDQLSDGRTILRAVYIEPAFDLFRAEIELMGRGVRTFKAISATSRGSRGAIFAATKSLAEHLQLEQAQKAVEEVKA
jgi:hypothetical protein